MSTLHKRKYGDWAGQPDGNPPDLTRCCEEVGDYSLRFVRYHQCNRKRGFGPEGAYCKQHDPEAVAKRQEGVRLRENERQRKERLAWYGPRFYAALKAIADGHNDARGLAAETIKDFDK